MVIDRVDERDKVVGTVFRQDVFKLHANFRVAHVFLFNTMGELLLQRLAQTHRRNPGLWGSSVAGYIYSGESYEDAARRRLNEELGIFSADLDFWGKIRMRDAGSLKYIGLFIVRSDASPSPDKREIAEVRFSPVPQVKLLVRKQPARFTPTFRELLAHYSKPQEV